MFHLSKRSVFLVIVAGLSGAFSACDSSSEREKEARGDAPIIRSDRITPVESEERFPAGNSNDVDGLIEGGYEGLVDGSKLTPAGKERFMSLVQACKLEDFEKVWDFLQESGVADSELALCRHILIQSKSRAGGLDRVLGKIEETFGSGILRSGYLGLALRSSNLSPEEILDRTADYSYPDEKKAVLGAFTASIRGLEQIGDLSFDSSRKFTDQELAALVAGLKRRIQIKGGESDLLMKESKEIVDWIKHGVGPIDPKNELLGNYLKVYAEVSPFEAWRAFGEERSAMAGKHRAGIEASMGAQMARIDGLEAVNALVGSKSAAGLRSAVGYWLTSDVASSSAWISTNLAGLTSSEKDAVALANVQYAIQNGEADPAEQWLNMIESKASAEIARRMVDRSGLNEIK